MAKIGIFVGTVYGGAEDVALWAQEQLQQAGHQAEYFIDESTLESFLTYQNDVVLVVTSTTGQGEIPETLLPLFVHLREAFPLLPNLNYGVIALGDASYGEERFCGGGRQFEALLQELQAKELTPRLDVDACIHFDPLVVAEPWLAKWQQQLLK
ncbi:TPA: flavodoxin [Photobacterium damselae]